VNNVAPARRARNSSEYREITPRQSNAEKQGDMGLARLFTDDCIGTVAAHAIREKAGGKHPAIPANHPWPW
jgi:hypothetical protein